MSLSALFGCLVGLALGVLLSSRRPERKLTDATAHWRGVRAVETPMWRRL